MKIAFFDMEDDCEKYIDKLRKNHDVSYYNEKINLNNLDTNIEILSFRSISKINKNIIDKLPKLKLLLTRTVGIDHIDTKYAKKKGIKVINIPDYGAHNIAEYLFALLLAGIKNIIKAREKTKSGDFSFKGLKGISLKGKTLGVIGTGNIGYEVITRAKVFGMNIIAYDIIKKPDIKYVELNELLSKSDIITLHIPLLKETKYIINEKSISLMKDNAILINTARGQLIDTKALIKALKKNKFLFVGLDVLEDEENFSKNNELLKFDNVLITPHIAFYTDEAMENVYKETIKAIENFIKQ